MSVDSRTVAGLKGQLSKFSRIIFKRFRKAKQRLIREMIYGIQAAKDVKLSNIARTLKEDQLLIETEDHLSRNLDDVDFMEGINDEICRLAASKVTDDMVGVIDLGDLQKTYAKKMEYWGQVWDGSESEVGPGYSLCKVVAADIESKRVIPLYCEAYSLLAAEVKSENSQIFKAIDKIFEHLGDRGIHAIDQGGDRGVIYKKYLGGQRGQRFVIRLEDRDLIHRGRRRNCGDLAKVLPMAYETVLIFYAEKGDVA